MTMKKILVFIALCISCYVSYSQTSDVIKLDDIEQSGYDMQKSINDDGSGFIERPYKWYSGIGKADDKQIALELAQREAYATISRIINNIVDDKCEKIASSMEGRVGKAVQSCWTQISQNIVSGCEPFGKAVVEYDSRSGMYIVTAKVAVRGDRFLKMLGEVSSIKVDGLSKSEMDEYATINAEIMEAARGE